LLENTGMLVSMLNSMVAGYFGCGSCMGYKKSAYIICDAIVLNQTITLLHHSHISVLHTLFLSASYPLSKNASTPWFYYYAKAQCLSTLLCHQ